jgi:transcriptional regulator with GAF, ATPase, and Fis domain
VEAAVSAPYDVLVGQLVVALSGVLARVAEPETVLATILRQAVSITGATRGVFVEVSPGGELAFSVLHSYRADALEDSGHYSRAVFATCLRTGEDLVLRNAVADMPVGQAGTVRLYRMAAVLCMPIRAGGRIAALLHLESGQVGYFDDSHRRLLRPILDLVAPVLEALAAGRAVLQERDRLAESEQRLLEEAEENRQLLARDWSFGRFVGRSPAVRELETLVRRAAAAPYPVLLIGETGTGKSILARILHAASPRARHPFVTVFCPSLEKSMLEAEMFGHRRGAFTGAVADRSGKVQAAERGTLFLDEIGDLPLDLQPKLLRLLQESTYERIGDPLERRADMRVIAATNRDIEQEVREGRFRRDLFERLAYVPVRVPPLRERREDIPAILRHCLDQTEAGRWVEIGPQAADYLRELDFSWPGNVRHLEQLAARITIEDQRRPITIADLTRLLDDRAPRSGTADAPEPGAAPSGARPPAPTAAPRATGLDFEAGLPSLLEEAEKSWLAAALARYRDLTRAELAAKLKISESALYKKLRLYGLGG